MAVVGSKRCVTTSNTVRLAQIVNKREIVLSHTIPQYLVQTHTSLISLLFQLKQGKQVEI